MNELWPGKRQWHRRRRAQARDRARDRRKADEWLRLNYPDVPRFAPIPVPDVPPPMYWPLEVYRAKVRAYAAAVRRFSVFLPRHD